MACANWPGVPGSSPTKVENRLIRKPTLAVVVVPRLQAPLYHRAGSCVILGFNDINELI
jgi:hypothetical protein